ncbi:MAG: asparaginase, partial [Deltaproteobacteria bacterium]|nr:asparaginase [Deltaproteobacteria bacterium]
MSSYLSLVLAVLFLAPVVSFAQAQPERGTPTIAQRADLPRVHYMMGPGTLPRNPQNRLEYVRYALTGEPRLTGRQLFERIPEVQQFARVSVEPQDFIPYDTPEELKALSLRIAAHLQGPDLAGVVFGHGTNNIEETAYFLNLTVRSDKPVVIVGSQRPFSTLSSDAPANLLNAIRVAADPASRGKGVLVLLNDEINAARDVTKTNTYRLETFQSRELGVLGYADPDRIVYYRLPTRKHTTQTEFDLTRVQSLPRVDILYVHSGNDGELAKAAVALGAKGLVIAGSGAGHTQNARKVLKELSDKQGVRVVRSARVGAGRVIREDNWQEPGFVAADNLSPQKARILLQLALTKTTNP